MESANNDGSGRDRFADCAYGKREIPRLSVVSACFNGAATIGLQLEALASQKWNQSWEVIIADNGSTDNSMDIVRSFEGRIPNLRIVDASARKGQPFALNTGVQTARASCIALCDDDDELAPGWIAAMGESLTRYPLVGCRFETKKLNPEWVANSRPNSQANGVQSYNYPPFLSHVAGCGLGFRKDVFRKIGGFDELFPLLHDTDFCWRAQQAGFELGFAGDALLHVRFRQDLKGMFKQARGYAEYNVLLYKRYRHEGMPPLHWKLGLRHWLDLVNASMRIRSKTDFARWFRKFGWQLGRTQASLKYRVMAI